MSFTFPGKLSHKKINDLITVPVITIGLYMIIFPWIPSIQLWFDNFTDDTNGYVYRGQLSSNTISDDLLLAPPTDNKLVIPDLSLDESVLEGGNIAVLNDGGVWRRPNTSTPDKGGNTVIIAHRFTYGGNSTFYHLDKMKPGHKFAVWWEGKEYIYEVEQQKVVEATALEIESNTDKPILTLYTCTPLWSAKDRLVVIAKLITLEQTHEEN